MAHVVLQVRDAEVDEHRLAVLEEDVTRLDVTVHDATGVDGADRLGDTAGEPEQLVGGERAVLLDRLVEGRPRHVARHDVGPRPHDVGVDDARHPVVADPRERVDLAAEATACVVVMGDVGAQHLDRDSPPARVEGEVDDAHATLADLLDQAVGAQALVPLPRRAALPLGVVGAQPGGRAGCPLGPVVRGHAPTVSDPVLLPSPARPVRRPNRDRGRSAQLVM